MDAPPSLAFVISSGASLCANCPGCRALYELDPLPIALAKGEATTVDKLKLRCTRCGSRASAFVTFPGNLLLGRDTWPARTDQAG